VTWCSEFGLTYRRYLNRPAKYSERIRDGKVEVDTGAANNVILAAAAHNMSRAQKRSRFVEDTGRKLK
jgi:hypothetical protein